MKKRKTKVAIILIIAFILSYSSVYSNFDVKAASKNKKVDIVLRYGKKKVIIATYEQNKKGYNKLIKQTGIKDIYKKLKVGKFYKDGHYSYKDEYGSIWQSNGWYNYHTPKDKISIDVLPIYSIRYAGKHNPPSKAYYVDIEIKSKKFSLNGIKVGMSREKASKILDKNFKNVVHCWKLYGSSHNHSWISAGYFSRGHIWVHYKKNKVSKICFINDYSSEDCRG